MLIKVVDDREMAEVLSKMDPFQDEIPSWLRGSVDKRLRLCLRLDRRPYW